jgi:dTDP-4-dehydrorhamnose reductase
MKKKLLVTGFGGFVAGSVIAQAEDDWDVHAVDQVQIPVNQSAINYYTLDLLKKEELTRIFYKINPHVIIHTAAMADIDFCQNNKEIAEKVNVGITKTLTELCGTRDSKIIFLSTDTVFDGEKGMYTEKDSPNPLNFYGETKVRAEKLIASLKNSVVCRLSLVMGLPVMGSGNSFLAKTIEKLKTGEGVKFPANEIRTPIDVITLGRALLELAGNDFIGTIHLAGNTRLNRFEMAQQIAETLGYDKNLIIATNSNAIEGRAPRPNDASLDNNLAKKILQTPMRSLTEGLELTMNFKAEKYNGN